MINAMKKILISFALIFALVSSVGAQNKTKTYNYDDFTGINASSAFQVSVAKAGDYSIKVEVAPEYEQYLDVQLKGGVLNLGFTDDLPRKMRTKSSKIVSAKVTMPNLTAVSLSGSADMVCNGSFAAGMNEVQVLLSGSSSLKGYSVAGSQVDIQVSGNSHLELDVEADEVDTKISGASKVVVSGISCELNGEISGASTLAAKDLSTEEASFDISGASRVSVSPSRELKVSISGASSCTYTDNKELRINARSVTGASTLKPAKQ